LCLIDKEVYNQTMSFNINLPIINSNSSTISDTTTIGLTVNPTTSTGGSLNVGGDLVLSGTTPRLFFPQDGTSLGPPTFTNRSAGTRLVIWPDMSPTAVDYAIGMENSTLWTSIAQNNSTLFFKWYGGTTQIMQLDGAGKLNLGPGSPIAGTSRLSIYGNAGSSDGPHLTATTTTDIYPVFQQLNWDHDNINLAFDGYFDGSNWRSSDVGSNLLLSKSGDSFSFQGKTGIAAGSIVTWDTMLNFDLSSNVCNVHTRWGVDIDSGTAFFVRPSAGGTNFMINVDTTTEIVTLAKTVLDHTDTEAFLVRKNADGGDVFTIDTTNSIVTVKGTEHSLISSSDAFYNCKSTGAATQAYYTADNSTNSKQSLPFETTRFYKKRVMIQCFKRDIQCDKLFYNGRDYQYHDELPFNYCLKYHSTSNAKVFMRNINSKIGERYSDLYNYNQVTKNIFKYNYHHLLSDVFYIHFRYHLYPLLLRDLLIWGKYDVYKYVLSKKSDIKPLDNRDKCCILKQVCKQSFIKTLEYLVKDWKGLNVFHLVHDIKSDPKIKPNKKQIMVKLLGQL